MTIRGSTLVSPNVCEVLSCSGPSVHPAIGVPVQTKSAVSLLSIQPVWSSSFGLSLFVGVTLSDGEQFVLVVPHLTVHPSFSCNVKLRRDGHISSQVCHCNQGEAVFCDRDVWSLKVKIKGRNYPQWQDPTWSNFLPRWSCIAEKYQTPRPAHCLIEMWPYERVFCFFTVGLVGLHWSHPVLSFFQIRKLEDDNSLLSCRIFKCTLLFSCRKTASIIAAPVAFSLVLLSDYRKLLQLLTSSFFYPLWNLLWNLFFLTPTRQEFWCYHRRCTCLHRKT